VVFFGGYALSLFSQFMPRDQQQIVRKISDFDVLSTDAEKTARIVVEQLKNGGFSGARSIAYPPIGEVLPKHFEIRVGGETLAFIYEPEECVNYNEVPVGAGGAGGAAPAGAKIRVATIDTILRFYLAFLYTDRPYFDTERLLCMANFLFRVQEQNRLNQQGMLRRFTTNCIGEQHTLEYIRAEKTAEYARLKNRQNDPEYDQWFLKYIPRGATMATSSHTAAPPAAAAAAQPPPKKESPAPAAPAQKKTPKIAAAPARKKKTKRRAPQRREKSEYLF
jgi:hypothetical protein